MIGIEKIVSGATGAQTSTITPPAGKEYVLKDAFSKHGVGDAAVTYALYYKTVAFAGNTVAVVALNVWTPLSDSMAMSDSSPIILKPDLYLYVEHSGQNITGFWALVLERPLEWELAQLEHQYSPDGNLMPPGMKKMIDEHLGYRSRMAKL